MVREISIFPCGLEISLLLHEQSLSFYGFPGYKCTYYTAMCTYYTVYTWTVSNNRNTPLPLQRHLYGIMVQVRTTTRVYPSGTSASYALYVTYPRLTSSIHAINGGNIKNETCKLLSLRSQAFPLRKKEYTRIVLRV